MYQEWSSEDSSYLELLATRGAQEVFAVRVSQHMEPQLVRAAESLVTLCALINLLWMETTYVLLDLELQITEQWNWFKKEICVVKQSQKFLAKKKKEKRILICSGFKISSSNSWYLSDTFYNRNCFCLLWDRSSLLKAFHVLRFFLQKNINEGSLWNPSTRKKIQCVQQVSQVGL